MAKCKLKTHICVKEESRNNQGRGIKPREQFRKHLRDVVNIVVRTRNGSGHGKRYSLAVGDIYGIGRLPFLASLISTALPTARGGGVAAVQFHAGHVQERPITMQNDAPTFSHSPFLDHLRKCPCTVLSRNTLLVKKDEIGSICH